MCLEKLLHRKKGGFSSSSIRPNKIDYRDCHSHKKEIVWKRVQIGSHFAPMLEKVWSAQIRCKTNLGKRLARKKMAEDFFLDVIFAVIDEDLLSGDPEEPHEAPAANNTFNCQFCVKKCVTQRGLTRHTNAKHQQQQNPDQSNQNTASANSKKIKSLEEILHTQYFKVFLEKCVKKLADDGCYPDNIRKEFHDYVVGPLDKVNAAYTFIKPIIGSFKGNADKFYPEFYKRISENADHIFQGLSRNCSLLLGFEVANHVLSHLCGFKLKNDVISCDATFLNEKERAIVGYLSGYVFGTMYRRIRFSSKSGNEYNQQYMSILLAGQSDNDLPEHKLVTTTRNRSGLWEMKIEVINIFIMAESTFKSMVSSLLENTSVLADFATTRNQAD